MAPETGVNVNLEEIHDPGHLPENEQAVIARIAGTVVADGISVEEAIADEFKAEDDENDPDDPITRGLVIGHLLVSALSGF